LASRFPSDEVKKTSCTPQNLVVAQISTDKANKLNLSVRLVFQKGKFTTEA